MATSTELPAEIWEKILRYLEPPDVQLCSRVCTKWRSIVYHGLLNPLFIPRVLCKIFQYLPFQSVLNFRQVCHQWNALLDNMTLEGFTIPGVTLTPKMNMTEVFKASSKVDHNPFPTRHVVVCFQCRGDRPTCVIYLRGIHELMKLYGNHISHLTVGISNSFHKSTWNKMGMTYVVNILHLLPNLKGLAVVSLSDISCEIYPTWRLYHANRDVCICDCGRTSANLPEFERITHEYRHPSGKFKLPGLKVLSLHSVPPSLYGKVLGVSPNIQVMDIQCNYYFSGLLLPSRLSSYICNSAHVTSLTLTLNREGFCEIEKPLSKAKLPMKLLSLCIYIYQEPPDGIADRNSHCLCGISSIPQSKPSCFDAVHNILRSCAHSLQTLDLNLVSNLTEDDPLERDFPSGKYLQKVDTLRLRGFKGSLDFLQEMNNLQRVYLAGMDFESQRTFVSRDSFYKRIPNLRKLEMSPRLEVGEEGESPVPEVLTCKQYFTQGTQRQVLWTEKVEDERDYRELRSYIGYVLFTRHKSSRNFGLRHFSL